jgi:hypothetical protein
LKVPAWAIKLATKLEPKCQPSTQIDKRRINRKNNTIAVVSAGGVLYKSRVYHNPRRPTRA